MVLIIFSFACWSFVYILTFLGKKSLFGSFAFFVVVVGHPICEIVIP